MGLTGRSRGKLLNFSDHTFIFLTISLKNFLKTLNKFNSKNVTRAGFLLFFYLNNEHDNEQRTTNNEQRRLNIEQQIRQSILVHRTTNIEVKDMMQVAMFLMKDDVDLIRITFEILI